MGTDSAVEAVDLVKHFGPIRAVDGISCDVPYGVSFGFLGPNGAGKTTTLRIMTGLARATAGRVVIEGWVYEYCHADDCHAFLYPKKLDAAEVAEVYHAYQPAAFVDDGKMIQATALDEVQHLAEAGVGVQETDVGSHDVRNG